MNIIKLIHRWLGALTIFTACLILAVMTVLVFMTVIYRYFLMAPISWGEELARFLFIALSMFGAAVAMKDRAHFAISILTDKFPRALRTFMEFAVALATSGLLSVVIVKGWGLMLLNRNQESPALEIPMSVPYAVIPVGFILMLIFLWTDLLIKRYGGDETRQEATAATPETITEGLL